MMRVARKIEVSERQKESPLELCLAIWLQWQRRDDTCIGWHRRSAMLEGDAHADSQQLYDNLDNNAALAVDTMISDLRPVQLIWAIRRRCGLASVWRFPSLVFADVLVDAELELEKKLKNNIATRTFFY